MGLLVLIAVPLALLAGAYFLTRAPASPSEPERPPEPSGSGPAPTKLDHGPMRDAVAAALRDRLAGWTLELPADEPLTLVAVDSATERRLVMDLAELAGQWHRAQAAGDAERASKLVEAFVAGATGEGAGTDAAIDLETLAQAIAVVLCAQDKVPRDAIVREAASLDAVLVLRRPEGYDLLARLDLEGLGLDEEKAFALALSNLRADVAEGLPMVVLDGTEDAPRVLQVAPDDPLAASYALVPELAQRMFERLNVKNVCWYVLGERTLLAADASVDIETVVEIEGQVLERAPIGPGDLAWR